MERHILHLLFFSAVFLRVSAEADGRWVRDVNFNLILNQGNSENLNTSIGLDLSQKTEEHEFRASAKYSYAESTFRDAQGRRDDRTTQEKTEAESQYNLFFSEDTYGLLGFSALKDRIADVDYRVLLGPGVGHYLVRNEIQTLAVEAGLSYLLEKVSEREDESILFRFSQSYTRQLSENANVWQSVEFLPAVDDFGDYLLNAELGGQARLNGNLSLRVVLKNRYDNTPGRDGKRNDLNLLAGVSYRF